MIGIGNSVEAVPGAIDEVSQLELKLIDHLYPMKILTPSLIS